MLIEAGPKKIYTHPAALEPRYFKMGQSFMFVGIPFSREAVEGSSLGFELSTEPVEVMPAVSLSGEIPRVTQFEGPEPDLFRRVGDEYVPDEFADDQSLVVDTPQGAVVITGCAHAGLVNTLKHVIDRYGKIRAVVGGTHLGMGAPPEKVAKTMDFLEEVLPDRMIVNHCTGTVVMSRMLDRFKDRFIPGQTGLSLEV